MTTAAFRKVFARVMADYGYSAEARRIAWSQCFNDDSWTQRPNVVRAYIALDRTRGPWVSARRR